MCTPSKAPKKTSYYSTFFAFMYDSLMKNIESQVLARRRKRLLASLSGNILEVGNGTGVNFTFYGPKAHVLAIEPSLAMLRQSEERHAYDKAQSNIQVLHAGIGDHFPIPNGGFSCVVCTLVLCSIAELEPAIETIKAVLQKNGKLVLLEHIESRNIIVRNIQHLLAPFWKKLAEGCHLNRNTAATLAKMGFRPQHESYFSCGLAFYEASGTFERITSDEPAFTKKEKSHA